MCATHKYEQDPEFRALVDFLHHRIAIAEYTPTELREACILAATHYESARNSQQVKVKPVPPESLIH